MSYERAQRIGSRTMKSRQICKLVLHRPTKENAGQTGRDTPTRPVGGFSMQKSSFG